MKFCGGRDARNSLQKAQLAEAGSPHLGKNAGARPRKDVTCQLPQHSFEPDLMGLRTANVPHNAWLSHQSAENRERLPAADRPSARSPDGPTDKHYRRPSVLSCLRVLLRMFGCPTGPFSQANGRQLPSAALTSAWEVISGRRFAAFSLQANCWRIQSMVMTPMARAKVVADRNSSRTELQLGAK